MSRIISAELRMVDLAPPTLRTDAIQSFVSQQTPIVTLTDDEGFVGTGYTYTIGTGGSSVVALLRDHFLPTLMGADADRSEHVWRTLLFSAHALAVGPISSLALAAIDVAMWDLRCRRTGDPLHRAVGGAHESLPMYSTEGGWLHLGVDSLVEDALHMQELGFGGAKIKIGKEHGSEDFERLFAVRAAVGREFELMADANQGLELSEARRRSNQLAEIDLAWIEEPLPADDVIGHAQLAATSTTPIAVGESLYSVSQFKDYLVAGAASIVQVDVARIGGITPWLKVAHLAEAFNVRVAPHFLMEIHASLACGVQNGSWIEYIPQLAEITQSVLRVENGRAYPSDQPGIGIEWNWDAIDDRAIASHVVSIEASHS